MNGKPTRWDYAALKAEWLQGEETLKAFAARKGITAEGTFYRKVKEYGWAEARERIRSAALAKIEATTVKKYAAEWERQMKLWTRVEDLADSIMTRREEFIDGSELAQLTAALDRALKSQRLIRGESTENVETKNYHLAIVQMLKDMGGGPPG